MKKFITVYLVFIILGYSCFCDNSNNLTENQKRKLVANLNYLQYSAEKICQTEDKSIAADEFYHIINDFDFGTYNDEVLNDSFAKFKENCASLDLTQQEKNFLIEQNKKKQKQAYLSAFSNLGSIFVPGQSWQQMAVSLVYTTVANTFSVMKEKSNLELELEKQMFYLDQDIAKKIYKLESTLDGAGRKALGNQNYEGLVKQNGMSEFVKYVLLDDPVERAKGLSETSLNQRYKFFPPYWYELGNAYQSSGQNELALKCYNTFEELKKTDVLEFDYTYIKVLRNKIELLLGQDVNNIYENARKNRFQIWKYLGIMEKNYLPSLVGEKNSYEAKIYFLLGDYTTALEKVNYLITMKTKFPEYLEDAIQLKILIEISLDSPTGLLYRDAEMYSYISFGSNNGINSNYFKSNKKNKEFSFFDEDHLYFTIPNQLLLNSKTFIIIDDVIYEVYKDNNYKDAFTSCLFINYELKNIKKEKSIFLHILSVDNYSETVIEYKIAPVSNNVYNSANKAYARIGSDILAHRAELVVSLGEMLKSYKYNVDDPIKELERITKEQKKIGEKNNRSKNEISLRISEEFNKVNNPDIEFIQDRVKANNESFFKSNNAVLYNSQIIKYGKNYYLIGINSLFNNTINKTVRFDSNANIYYYDENNNVINSIPETLKDYFNLATVGNISAMVNLGLSFYDGLGVEKNYKKAIYWLIRAINIKKNTPLTSIEKIDLGKAYKCLGNAYLEGKGVEKNEELSKLYFNKANQNGVEIEKKYLK